MKVQVIHEYEMIETGDAHDTVLIYNAEGNLVVGRQLRQDALAALRNWHTLKVNNPSEVRTQTAPGVWVEQL